LRRTLHKHGELSEKIINSTKGLPNTNVFYRRFGSLREAYRLIGHKGKRNFSFMDAKAHWAEVAEERRREIGMHLERLGRTVALTEERIRIDRKVEIDFRVSRAYLIPGQLSQYRIPNIRAPKGRWMVAIRLTDDMKSIRDYVMIPTTGLAGKYKRNELVITDKACDRLGFDIFKSPRALAAGIHRKISLRRTRAPSSTRQRR
jgi:hypothetical protein